MIDEMAAARAAVKLGSEVMAAVAALKVSGNPVPPTCNIASRPWEDEVCNPENLDWFILLANRVCPNI